LDLVNVKSAVGPEIVRTKPNVLWRFIQIVIILFRKVSMC